MIAPYKPKNSDFYHVRKVVPLHLRALVGKTEEKRSLGTKDPAEAKRRTALFLAELDVKWTRLEAGVTSLSEREALQIAEVEVYDKWIEVFKIIQAGKLRGKQTCTIICGKKYPLSSLQII